MICTIMVICNQDKKLLLYFFS